MGFSLNKLLKGMSKDEKKVIEEREIRLKSIMNEAAEIFTRRSVTVVEMHDMLMTWIKMNTDRLIELNQNAYIEIDRLKKENKEAEERIDNLIKQINKQIDDQSQQ